MNEERIKERQIRNGKKRKAFSDWMEIVTEVILHSEAHGARWRKRC